MRFGPPRSAGLCLAAGLVLVTSPDGSPLREAAAQPEASCRVVQLEMTPTAELRRLLNGYQVCARIRAQAWGSAIVMIAVSGWGQEEDRRRSALAGFNLHLVKPVDPEILLQVVREAIAERA